MLAYIGPGENPHDPLYLWIAAIALPVVFAVAMWITVEVAFPGLGQFTKRTIRALSVAAPILVGAACVVGFLLWVIPALPHLTLSVTNFVVIYVTLSLGLAAIGFLVSWRTDHSLKRDELKR